MKQAIRLAACIILIATASCKTTKNVSGNKDDGKIEVVFVQVNDVYEIAPIAGGTQGGMARVATLKKQYKQTNPNTFLVMAGDFISPSVYNSLQNNGKRIRGAEMIDCMNSAGMDIAVFGNHEFDFGESDLQERINESGFLWVSSNTFHKTKNGIVPFARTGVHGTMPFPKMYIMKVQDKDGTTAKIGFIGVTLNSNKADYVSYDDPLVTAKQLYSQLKDSVDAVVAITHQKIQDDILLAKEVPGLAAILGGHEHDMKFSKTGNVYITKAHSNARSAYIVKLDIDKNKHRFNVSPELKYINESVAIDSTTNVVVKKWKKIAEDNYGSLGFDPAKIVLASGQPLDGRDAETHRHSTNLTRVVTQAMADACPQADAVVVNTGSLRLDDILTPPISEYDVIRILPFGGGIREADMKGSLLLQILQASEKNMGEGGFLAYQPITFDSTTKVYAINNTPIDPSKTYRVALPDFLLAGKEINMGFLTENNPAIVKVYPAETAAGNPKSDIRLAIIKYLEKQK